MTRLDKVLMERKLVKSRSQGEDLIARGKVTVNGHVTTKTSSDIAETDIIVVEPLPFVSRAGEKLEHALKAFGVVPTDLTVLDVGSSTGGFTDCILKHGARKVYAIDVGTDQFDRGLALDPRIVLMEKTDIRSAPELPEKMDLILADVSFISLTLVIPHLRKFLKEKGSILLLVKPQFEVGKERLPRDGVVKEQMDRDFAKGRVVEALKKEGFEVVSETISPVVGETGNIEYFFLVK